MLASWLLDVALASNFAGLPSRASLFDGQDDSSSMAAIDAQSAGDLVAEASPPVKISVKTLTGQVFLVELQRSPANSVSDIKQRIEASQGTPPAISWT